MIAGRGRVHAKLFSRLGVKAEARPWDCQGQKGNFPTALFARKLRCILGRPEAVRLQQQLHILPTQNQASDVGQRVPADLE